MIFLSETRNCAVMFLSFIWFAAASLSQAVDPPYGQLSVENGQLVGKDKKQVQLVGMSLFWSEWMGQYYNKETVQALKCSWNANVVRAAMGVEEDKDGYLKDKSQLDKLKAVVQAAIDVGIYVLIDWHAHKTNTAEAVKFFDMISQLYGKYPNVLYETYNEPIDSEWNPELKNYHEAVIKAIRKNDPTNVIICGTKKYSQEVDVASQAPITIDKNICYTLHFYAGSHKEDIRAKAKTAIANKQCVFVTEWGTVNADGNGAVDEASTKAWWEWLDQNKISYLNWAIEDKPEGAAALQQGTTSAQVGDDSKLTASGKFVKNKIKGMKLISCDGSAPAGDAGTGSGAGSGAAGAASGGGSGAGGSSGSSAGGGGGSSGSGAAGGGAGGSGGQGAPGTGSGSGGSTGGSGSGASNSGGSGAGGSGTGSGGGSGGSSGSSSGSGNSPAAPPSGGGSGGSSGSSSGSGNSPAAPPSGGGSGGSSGSSSGSGNSPAAPPSGGGSGGSSGSSSGSGNSPAAPPSGGGAPGGGSPAGGAPPQNDGGGNSYWKPPPGGANAYWQPGK